MGHSKPLIQERLVWESEAPLTRGQLQGKRDTFWETAPLYEGRKEIWDALKAAIEAAEEGDYDLAQAILTGANISLPKGNSPSSIKHVLCFTGKLTDAYDELGNRYAIPLYCISRPLNMVNEDSVKTDVVQTNKVLGDPVTLKIRLTTSTKDIKVTVSSTDTVSRVKEVLEKEHNVDGNKITMLFSGKILPDSAIIGQLKIPKGFIIQAIVRS